MAIAPPDLKKPTGIKKADRQNRSAFVLDIEELSAQVPVRLSLPKRRTTRRSTTTERCAPCSPAITRVADRAELRATFFTSASTGSSGIPIRDAAISA